MGEPYLVVTDGPPGKVANTLIALSELLDMRRAARRIAEGQLGGSPDAMRAALSVAQVAQTSGAPGRAHAIVMLHLLADALQEIQVQMQFAQAQQAQMRPPPPQPAQPVAPAQVGQEPKPLPCKGTHADDTHCDACVRIKYPYQEHPPAQPRAKAS